MQNLSDKELDEFMKKANESQSYPYDADSWPSLADMLDKTPRRGFASGQSTLLILFAGVMVVFLFYFTMSKENPVLNHAETSLVVRKKQEVNTAETNTVVGEESKATSELDTQIDKALTPGKNQQYKENIQPSTHMKSGMYDANVAVEINQTENSATISEEQQRTTPTLAKQSNAAETLSGPVKNTVEGSLTTQRVITYTKDIPSEMSVSTNNQASNVNVIEYSTPGLAAIRSEEKGKIETINNISSLQKEQNTSSKSTKSVHANFLPEEAIIDSAAADKNVMVEVKSESNVKDSVDKKLEETIGTGHFAIKLSISPDFSSQSFSKTDAMGWNYGAAVEYNINNAFAVSAGLLNTRKYYTAEDVTYGQYTAEFAEGDCRMLDIPVNVHYYIPSKQSLQLIASLGFSSYIMKQENYTYYPDESNLDRKYYSEIRNENSEWFKVLNVSLAAQLKVSPVLFVQLEPFIKAPLTGLGEGNISLSSFGTFFTIKYQLFTKNTRNNVH